MKSSSDQHVLVVEDDADMLDTFVQVLEAAGYRASGAANGVEALALLRNGLRPAAILLDLMMPEMTGWEFREEQLRDPALASLPVIVVSAAGPLAERESLRASAFLSKPLDLHSLLDALQNVCH
jgi:CheY-like chemotaxis protein